MIPRSTGARARGPTALTLLGLAALLTLAVLAAVAAAIGSPPHPG